MFFYSNNVNLESKSPDHSGNHLFSVRNTISFILLIPCDTFMTFTAAKNMGPHCQNEDVTLLAH